MKKMKFLGGWTAVLLLAALLALAGCDNGSTEQKPATPETGASIESFDPLFDGITPSAFSIRDSSRAVVADPNPGNQVPEYAVSTGTTAPTSGWQNSLTFSTGITPETTYYVFARARATTSGTTDYAEGPAFRGSNTVRTAPEGEEASVVSTWNPNPSSYTDVEAGTFEIKAATPVGGAGPGLLYALNTNGTTQPTTGFNSRRSFNITAVSETAQSFFWAKTDEPDAIALPKAVSLPGASVSATEVTVAANTYSSTEATVSIGGTFTKSPDIESQAIVFALGNSGNVATASFTTWKELSETTGTIAFDGLSANTSYWLYAKASAAAFNFREGDPQRITETSFFTTGAVMSNVESLADRINNNNTFTPATSKGTASPLPSDNMVLITGNVTLGIDIAMPDGVTLTVGDGSKFRTQLYAISGGGTSSINVLNNGELHTNGTNVTVTITVNNGGKYFAAGETTPTIGTSGVIVPGTSAGSITVKYNGNNRFDYGLAGKATISEAFNLGASHTFAVNPGAELEITRPNGAPPATYLSMAGKIDVKAGGILTVPDYTFIEMTSPDAMITINTGATLQKTNGTEIFTVGVPLAVPTHDFTLGTGTQTKIEITKAAGATMPRFKLTGPATVAKTSVTLDSIILEVSSGTGNSVTVPEGRTLTVGGTTSDASLIVNGLLTLAAKDTGSDGGKLVIGAAGGGSLTGSGTITANEKAGFDVKATAKTMNFSGPVTLNKDVTFTLATLTATPAINTFGGTVSFRTGTAVSITGTATFSGAVNIANENTHVTINEAVTMSGAVDISSGAKMTVASMKVLTLSGSIVVNTGCELTTSGRVAGSGSINVKSGKLLTTGNPALLTTHFNTTGTGPLFTGNIKISESGMICIGSTTPYIGYATSGANNPATGFRLATPATATSNYITITFNSALGAVPAYELTGTAYVEGSASQTVLSEGKFDVKSGSTLNFADGKKLELKDGTELQITGSLAVPTPTTAAPDLCGIIMGKNGTGGTARLSGGPSTKPAGLRLYGTFTSVPNGWTIQAPSWT